MRFSAIACVAGILVLLVVMASVFGCQEMPNKANEAIKIVREDIGKVPPRPSFKSLKPRLVVDVTLSMAGYVSPPNQRPSEFTQALEEVASSLPEHDLFVFGTRKAKDDSSLDDMLVSKASGLGRDFARDDLFRGSNNQDDLLFKAAGRDEDRRPLVFVTDGVYSSPSGRGIQPVGSALDELLQAGWSVGFIALRSSYYGVRCELTKEKCSRGVRLLYSEASTQRGEGGFVSMPCSSIRDRPFYVVVLSPTSALFKDLSSRLKATDLFLFDGSDSPIKLGAPIADKQYDRQDAIRWLMLSKNAPADVTENYSIDPLFPVELVHWTVQAEKVSWKGKKFDNAWVSVNLPDPRQSVEPEKNEEGSAAMPERLRWRTFSQDLASFQLSLAQVANTQGMIAIQHRATIETIQRWHPDIGEMEGLYCEYLGQSSSKAPGKSLSNLQILLAADALRRQRPGEVSANLEPLLHSAPGSANADLEALAKDLAGSASEALGPTLAAAREETLPAGRPPRPGRVPSGPLQKPVSGRFEFSVLQDHVGATYKLHLVPSPVRFSRLLRNLATGDDSDVAFANRTYRLDSLLEYLATAQMERSGARGALTVYVTVPGR